MLGEYSSYYGFKTEEMELRVVCLLTLLGVLFVEPGFGQRGDIDINEWLKDKVEFIKKLEEKLKEVEGRQNDFDALETKLNATVDEVTRQKAEMDKLKKENEGLQTRLNATEEEVDKLKQNSAKGGPQIAFSASLANFGEIYKGPCTDKALIFKRVFSNTGNGYDPNTGIFTAPLDGGDKVYMELWDNGRVFDNMNGHTTFSGFLVFPA
ncbi:hypothetical protein F7725_004731 [Dissostichus mawsoni]|uniref:C1q domain-containing protein n=1 Tax=Dissostichus mawsoni TaxID=36200 RepID=A0A7J5XL09_DISMA|nr:hypothetical protein F7725_004731 [Dissostichus mawsoni]